MRNLAPEAYVPNKFYIHNYMLCYKEEVFGEAKPQLDEESDEENKKKGNHLQNLYKKILTVDTMKFTLCLMA